MGIKLTFSKNIKYWLIPISAVVILWVLSGSVFYYYTNSQDTKLQVETEVTGEQIKLRLESWVNHRIEIVENMAFQWSKHKSLDKVLFTQKAEELLSWLPGLQALNYIDKDWNIQVVVPHEGNEPALGKDLHMHPSQSVQLALSKAQKTRQISRTTIIELLQGGEGFATYWPVISNKGEIIGFINGVFKVDQLIESCFSEPLLTERFSILFYENNKSVYNHDTTALAQNSELIKNIPVQFVDKNLQMKIVPSKNYIKASKNYISFWILGFTFFFSLGLGYLLRKSMLQNQIVRQSEARFKAVVENAGEAFFLIADGGKIVDVNQQACKELQYTKDELISMNLAEIDDDYYSCNEVVFRTGTYTFETKHKKKDGTIIPVEIRSGLIEINKVPYVLCLSRDISESKKIQELESRAQRLETAGQVAGQVAHDFNNLLAPLIAYPEFIQEMLDENHPAIELLNKIEKSANQIAEINQQLLTLGRRGHYNQQVVNLNDLIMQVIEDVKIQFESKIIEKNLDVNLLPIKCGNSQIIRIITNLLYNSYDAIQDGGRINVKTENYYLDKGMSQLFSIPKGEYVKLTVSDNGHGIPSGILPTIFDPFVSTKKADKKRGSGLGLSIVESVVKDHNGFIDVKSIVGEGTDFYIYFPISRENVNSENSLEIIGGNEKVLIVDDDEMILEVTQKILDLLGYKTKTVENGEIALKLLKSESFDLLILDMIIPNSMDGTEIYKNALIIDPTQKAIIVSGYAESDRVEEAMRLGVKSFIKKPFTKEVIAKEIRNTLQKELVS